MLCLSIISGQICKADHLSSHRKDPSAAVKQLPEWIESERIEGQRRRAVERKERDKANERAQRAPVLQKGTPAESPAGGINVRCAKCVRVSSRSRAC